MTNSKLDAKREAEAIALQKTLNMFVAAKGVKSEKREERKRRKTTKNFFELQKKSLRLTNPMTSQE